MLFASQCTKKAIAFSFTKVRSFKSKTIGRRFDSELISVFNSAIASSSIWPLTVKTTSPFSDLWILSILCRHLDCMPKANGKLLILQQLATALIVQVGQLAKFVQSQDLSKLVQKGLLFSRIGDLEAVFVDL
jgi:hypothetical protein